MVKLLLRLVFRDLAVTNSALMITPGSTVGETSFVSKKLPWLIGAAATLFYLVTVGHWITPGSLENIANISGWNERPAITHPLSASVFLIFKLLPEAWIPLMANCVTSLCAALCLVLLARCVALLRYDMQPEGDIRKTAQVGLLNIPSAWMPPVMAVVVCGLQLSFWEHATAATGEILAPLLLAFAVRSLLEFRVTQNETWLARGVLAYGAGMADNWVMIGYLPVLIAALIGLKRFSAFLDLRFLFRMALCGLGGVLLCLLVPAVVNLSSSGVDAMGAALTAHFKSLKQMLLLLQWSQLRLFAVTGLIPFLILSVRWKSHTIQAADDTPQGVFFAKVTGHFVHAFLFIVALWLTLEPALTPKTLDLGGALLIHHFIWAMAAGYCAGYVLLFKQGTVQRRPSKLATMGIRLLLIAIAALLFWKNFGSIQITNGSAMREFAKTLADDLPPRSCAVVCEERRILMVLRGELGSRGRTAEVMLVDTPQLIWPRYHQAQAAKFGARWPNIVGTNTAERIPPSGLVKFVTDLQEKEMVFYAHPSSGLFFERFFSKPARSLHQLILRTNDSASSDVTALADAEKLWQARWESHVGKLAARIATMRSAGKRWSNPSLKWLRVADRENATAVFLSGAYSKSLNYFGVQLLRAGQGDVAKAWFQRAIQLNPVNVSALINLEVAERRSRGDTVRLKMDWAREHFSDAFDHCENWWEVLSRNGPVDDATFLLQSGQLFMSTSNPRQATEAFTRCQQLSPDWPIAKLGEARMRNAMGEFNRAFELADGLDAISGQFTGSGLAQLLLARVTAQRGLNRTNEAWSSIEQYVARFPKHGPVISAAATLCSEERKFERELELLTVLSSLVKADANLLARIGLAEFRLGRNKQSTTTLTRALDLAPDDVSVRLLRATVQIASGESDGARADYKALLKSADVSQQALFGLGNMAWRSQDKNTAIRYYEQFMSNNAYATPQAGVATERLKQMREE